MMYFIKNTVGKDQLISAGIPKQQAEVILRIKGPFHGDISGKYFLFKDSRLNLRFHIPSSMVIEQTERIDN